MVKILHSLYEILKTSAFFLFFSRKTLQLVAGLDCLTWGTLGIKLFQPNKHLIGIFFQQVKLFQIHVFGARKAEFKLICSHAGLDK